MKKSILDHTINEILVMSWEQWQKFSKEELQVLQEKVELIRKAAKSINIQSN